MEVRKNKEVRNLQKTRDNECSLVKKTIIHDHLKIKFWGPHPSRNQSCICAELNFIGNVRKSLDDKSILQHLKVKYYEPDDFWGVICEFVGYKPRWLRKQQTLKKIDAIEQLIEVIQNKIRHYKNFKRSKLILFLLFLLLVIPGLIYLNNTSSKKVIAKLNYWQELYKEKSLNLANEKQILQMIEKEKETSDGDEILENLPELKFIKYCDFISECRYDGKAVYILYFIDNKKFYVGQTRTLLSRQKNHIDWKKGVTKNPKFPTTQIDNILISYIESNSLDEINALEKEYINKTGSFIDGYNSTQGNN